MATTVYSQIESLEKQRADIDRRLAEALEQKKALESLTPAQQVAILLHTKLCHANHTDGCGWEYEADWQGARHQRYLEVANKMLTYSDFRSIINIFNVLGDYGI